MPITQKGWHYLCFRPLLRLQLDMVLIDGIVRQVAGAANSQLKDEEWRKWRKRRTQSKECNWNMLLKRQATTTTTNMWRLACTVKNTKRHWNSLCLSNEEVCECCFQKLTPKQKRLPRGDKNLVQWTFNNKIRLTKM